MPKKTPGDYLSMPDLSSEVPDLIPYLRRNSQEEIIEKVISVAHDPTPSFDVLPDYRDELCKLCGVDKPEDIGKNGPAMASRSISAGAGQKKYECRFGRDGLIAALDFLDEFPLLTRATLLNYATLIGMSEDTYREEEVGRMFHEARDPDDPIAKQLTEEKGWGWPFYATVDATPLFVIVLYNYVTKSSEGKNFLREKYIGRDGETHVMMDALRLSMSWIVKRITSNAERFLEFKAAFPGSHVTQVMEDSWDSHFHADGTLANFEQGVCSTEVQALVFDALVYAARLIKEYEVFKNEVKNYELLADEVRASFLKYLLVHDGQGGCFFAVGADRDEVGYVNPMEVKKAIPFFVLNSGLLFQAAFDTLTVERCVRTLFSPELICAAGVRSLALDEKRFMPGAYHNGNSWCMQTFQIAEGLRLHGYHALAAELDRRIIATVEQTKLYPEYVNGGTQKEIRMNERIVDTYDLEDMHENRREQPPQQIQLWTLTAYGTIQYRIRTGPRTTYRIKPLEEKILSNIS